MTEVTTKKQRNCNGNCNDKKGTEICFFFLTKKYRKILIREIFPFKI